MKTRWVIFTSFVLMIILSACKAPTPQIEEAGFVLVITPAEGAQFSMSDTVDVYSKAGDPNGILGVQLLVNGKLIEDSRFDPPVTNSEIHQNWKPAQPGNYQIQVSIERSDSGYLISNPVNVTINPAMATAAPTAQKATATIPIEPVFSPTLPSTMTPSETPTETVTPTLGVPMAEATIDSNCRAGPGKMYRVINWLKTGETAPIVGRNKDNSYWVITISNRQCWIWNDLVIVSGDTSDVPIFRTPPTLTPTNTKVPTACHDYTDAVSCNTDPLGFGGCTWHANKNECKP